MGLCPRGRGPCPGGSLSRWVSVRGVSVLGVLGRGDPPGQRLPPYGNEWAVRILLECILVGNLFLTIVAGND